VAPQVCVVSENLKNDSVVHPADALASALDRANGLLIVLMDLYEARREAFVGGNPFIVHGMSTVSDLLEDARQALSDLHDQCDLSLKSESLAAVITNIVEMAAKLPDTPNATLSPGPAMGGLAGLKPALKPIAAAVVTLRDADETAGRVAKGHG
jgi:hypothetical protein